MKFNRYRANNASASLNSTTFFDLSSYRGNVFGIVLSILITAILWHLDVLFAAVHHGLGIPYEINLAKQSWAQLMALAIGAVAIGGHVLAIVGIFLRRRSRVVDSMNDRVEEKPGSTVQTTEVTDENIR